MKSRLQRVVATVSKGECLELCIYGYFQALLTGWPDFEKFWVYITPAMYMLHNFQKRKPDYLFWHWIVNTQFFTQKQIYNFCQNNIYTDCLASEPHYIRVREWKEVPAQKTMASKGKRQADECQEKKEMHKSDTLCPRSRSKSEPVPSRKPRAPNQVPDPWHHAEPLS